VPPQATGGPVVKSYADLAFSTQANGQPQVQVQHAWGQVWNIYFGLADTAFSDPDAFPNMLDVAGPNAEVYLQHPLIAYIWNPSPNSRTQFSARLSVEAPEASVTPNDPAPGDLLFWNSRSRIPDFAGNVRLADKCCGHLQFATVLRDVGIENTSYRQSLSPPFVITGPEPTEALSPSFNSIPANHQDVFGWGLHFTGVVLPFRDLSPLSDDRVSFGTLYGEGVANYVLDLRALGGYDAFFEAGRLKALPVWSYWAAYTHFWTQHLSSTMVYSQVDVDSFQTAGLSTAAYRHGRLASVNLVYQWVTPVTEKQAASARTAAAPPPKPQYGKWFTGIEYVFGEKENVSDHTGVDHRIQATVGVNF
jgi:hypothetical protein